VSLEPKLEELWKWYFSLFNEEIELKVKSLYSRLAATLLPKYHLAKDIAKVTGT